MLRRLGGEGPPVLLLHGLAGHAGEWAGTADWLASSAAVFALDGESGVGAAAAAVAEIGAGPVACVGQSLGGRTAIELAARRPELVRALVVAEADPEGGPELAEEVAERVERAFARWPESFAGREQALEFFGGPSLRAEAWADGLRERDGRLWPWFDRDAAVEELRSALARPLWEDWERIACPTLIVRGAEGDLDEAIAERMAALLPRARVATIPGAGHEVHLDRPTEWRAALDPFLRDTPPTESPRHISTPG
jgi:pimeloyl-ACP methyl ester carboxylesterase